MNTNIETSSTSPAEADREPVEISVVLPVYNEAGSIGRVIGQIQVVLSGLGRSYEILVVDDGSTDLSGELALDAGAQVILHRLNLGNGAAVKAGARRAAGSILVLMDADGQHDPADIPRLLEKIDHGHDMAVGARSNGSQSSWTRLLGNGFYNRMATLMTGRQIHDLTSGFRAARMEKFREFLHLLPNGFSYPTTITMAFFRSGYSVDYVPISAGKRNAGSSSGISILRDGTRFLLIIMRVGTLYSPLKVFFPASMTFFLLGLGYYLYTFFNFGRFTNMSALLLSTSVVVFLMGLVSEQVTQLLYRPLQAPGKGRMGD